MQLPASARLPAARSGGSRALSRPGPAARRCLLPPPPPRAPLPLSRPRPAAPPPRPAPRAPLHRSTAEVPGTRAAPRGAVVAMAGAWEPWDADPNPPDPESTLMSMLEGPPPQKAVVAGGGTAGSLAAIILRRAGYDVEVFEQRRDPIKQGWPHDDCNFNVVLHDRAQVALRRAGVDVKALTTEIVQLRGHFNHSPRPGAAPALQKGAKLQKGEKAPISISSDDLAATLIAAARLMGVGFRFNVRFQNLDVNDSSAGFISPSGTKTRHKYDVLVGADGAYSRVRKELTDQERMEFNYAAFPWKFKTLRIGRGGEGSAKSEGLPLEWQQATHSWGGFHLDHYLFAAPNPDGTLTGVLWMPSAGAGSFEMKLKTERNVKDFFQAKFPGLLPHLHPAYATRLSRQKARPGGVSVLPRALESAAALGEALAECQVASGGGLPAPQQLGEAYTRVHEKNAAAAAWLCEFLFRSWWEAALGWLHGRWPESWPDSALHALRGHEASFEDVRARVLVEKEKLRALGGIVLAAVFAAAVVAVFAALRMAGKA